MSWTRLVARNLEDEGSEADDTSKASAGEGGGLPGTSGGNAGGGAGRGVAASSGGADRDVGGGVVGVAGAAVIHVNKGLLKTLV